MSEKDVNGFSVVSEADALSRLGGMIEDWRRRGMPDTAYRGVLIGDIRRLWEAAFEMGGLRLTEEICDMRLQRLTETDQK